MKIKSILHFTITCLSISLIVSCESHEQKTDDAFEQVKDERLLSKNIRTIQTESPKKTEIIKKIEVLDEWAIFKMETEKKIVSNNNRIVELKKIPNASNRLIRILTNLEKDNFEMRKEMDEYSEEVKMRWEGFKSKINHDINEIKIELKDITLNNK